MANTALYPHSEKGHVMDEKKRERLMKVIRVVALILAVIMIIGVAFQGFLY